MSKRRTGEQGIGGLDSFQDIVANLVGILIILVIVVMMRARDALVEQPELPEITKVTQQQVKDAESMAIRVEDSILELDDTLSKQKFELKYRKLERDRMLNSITLAEAKLASRQQALTTESQASLALNSQYEAMSKELGELIRSRQVLQQMKPEVHVIEHMPTPMAKTVFGKEMHFRLENGSISYVPFDELVDRMQRTTML